MIRLRLKVRAEFSFFPARQEVWLVWFTVLRAGVPVGAVELPARETAAGRPVRLAGYGVIADRVRAASEALLAYGLYGPPASAVPDPARRRARAALRAGATLGLELRALLTGEVAAVTFVNLFAAPGNGEVVVVACFHSIPIGAPAAGHHGVRADENEADLPPGEQ